MPEVLLGLEGLDEAVEHRVRSVWTAFELWVELAGQEEWMVSAFDDFN